MKNSLRYFALILLFLGSIAVEAQVQNWQTMHKVKKKETLFGISRQYGITVEELKKANPEMNMPNYKLRKGDYIYIPYPTPEVKEAAPTEPAKPTDDITKRAIRVGVMLPLHDVDGDGRRMVEYYRGMLMAFNDLRQEGISIDVRAWNVNIDADIRQTLLEKDVDKLDIIFGPLYTKQVKHLGDFARKHNIRMVIPFSINGNEVAENPFVYQVYQSPEELNTKAINAYLARFADCHPVIVDCNDKTSTKGSFTFGLRQQLEKQGIAYSITNLTSSDEMFAKAFALDKPNVVILNTGRSPELTATFKKLDVLTQNNRDLSISMYGYTDWLLYEKIDKDRFYQYDVFIPTHFYHNASSTKTGQLEAAYQRWFHTPMMEAKPRFALTGYDQATFFLRGIHHEGNNFRGDTPDTKAVQTQFKFSRVGTGGWQNNQFMLIHYNRNRTISNVTF